MPRVLRAKSGGDLRFVAADGAPISGALASLEQRSDAAFGVGGGSPLVGRNPPRSDSDGWLRLDSDLGGDLKIHAAAEGYLRKELYLIKPELTVRLVRVVVLDRARSLRGVVVDPQGRGVAKASVSARGTTGTQTDSDGRFELSGLQPRATIFVRAGDRVRSVTTQPDQDELRVALVAGVLRFELDLGEDARDPFVVRIDGQARRVKHRSPVELPVSPGRHTIQVLKDLMPAMQRSFVVPEQGGTVDLGVLTPIAAQVRGRVLGGSGPLQGALVAAFDTSTGHAHGYVGTDGEGSFELDLEPGRYRFEISHADHTGWKGDSDVPAAGMDLGALTLDRGVRWTLRLQDPEGGSIWMRTPTVTWIDGDLARELEFGYHGPGGAKLESFNEDISLGRPTLRLNGLPSATKRVWVTMRGYAPSEAKFSGAPTREQPVVLRPGGSVGLRVTHASGQPARFVEIAAGPRALVRARRRPPSARWQKTNARGRVVLDRLPPGRWPVFRRGQGGEVEEIGSVDVRDQDLARFELFVP
ncbi:MAG: carboxypeptidase regulatory-like domain-containing protein [Planctomycetes bacterium]|nr:carboxypeptidase regulatory-like domain-containing protein [Planctomycetota bacterium]